MSGTVATLQANEALLTPLGAEMVGALGVEAQVAFGELTLVAPRERWQEALPEGLLDALLRPALAAQLLQA